MSDSIGKMKIPAVIIAKYNNILISISKAMKNDRIFHSIKNAKVRVDWWGFEPQTPRVQGEYSTAELPAHCMD